VHGREEIEMIRGGGDDKAARVAMASERSGDVNQVHQAAAEEIPEWVRVVGKNNLNHFRLGVAHGTGQKSVFRSRHIDGSNSRL
jgi:hypothetical protein